MFDVCYNPTWYKHAGKTFSVPDPQDVLKGTEVQPPHGAPKSVSHVGFSHRRTPHIPVNLQELDTHHESPVLKRDDKLNI